MRTIIFIFFTLYSFLHYAQHESTTPIIVEGKIIDANNHSPIPFVHIVNASTNQGTASNSQGRFEIYMDLQDTLLFSAIGFEQYTFTLLENIDTKRIFVKVLLNATAMKLDPVKIFAYKDERTLKRAIIDMELPEENSQSIKLDGVYYSDKPYKRVAPSPFSNPISFIYSKLSKKERERRKYAKVSKSYEHWKNNVYIKYNPYLVQQATGLKEDEIGDFMKFCQLKESFIELSTPYDVMVAIHKCFEEYKELRIKNVELRIKN